MYALPSSSFFLASVISFRLCPEQKTSPTAAMIMTLIELSEDALSKRFLSWFSMSFERAFLLLGSSSTNRRMLA